MLLGERGKLQRRVVAVNMKPAETKQGLSR